jgi:hypothetical protein
MGWSNDNIALYELLMQTWTACIKKLALAGVHSPVLVVED